MIVLVAGATGATGRRLAAELLARGHDVRAIVRSGSRLPDGLHDDSRVTVIRADIAAMTDAAMREAVRGCDGIASCLGHAPSLRGVFGPPYRLVTDAVRRLAAAIRAVDPPRPVRFVLMSSNGVGDPDAAEPLGRGDRIALFLIRGLVPPHRDNELAAEELHRGVGRGDPAIEWVAVRPDNLTESDEVGRYTVHPTRQRGVIFDAGKTHRIQVAHFMAELLADDGAWDEWKGRMPVIYDAGGT